MSEAGVDFYTLIAPSYELRPANAVPAKFRAQTNDAPQLRFLVPVGKPKLVRPRRTAVEYAVSLMLKTFKPIVKDHGDHWRHPDAEETAALERNSLAIAKHIGLLNTLTDPKKLGPYLTRVESHPEHLSVWAQWAERIQLMFAGPPRPVEIGVCSVFVFLDYKASTAPAMSVRPGFVGDALIYKAAQMIARGTISQTCENCGTTFLSGGGNEKKRGGSRFCSDGCRWQHHNQMRRKSRQNL
jgi:hypothetical protein